MLTTLQNWFRGFKNEATEERQSREHLAWVPKKQMPSRPLSMPPVNEGMGSLMGEEFLPAGVIDPRLMYPLFRRLRDYVPDVSAGVWAWVRLCSTEPWYGLHGGTESQRNEAVRLLEDLDRRIYGLQTEQAWGVDALVQCYFLSIFTYGSFCGEVILDDSRRKIDRFVIIDPATIRFKLEQQSRSYLPYQIREDGSTIQLNPVSFFYQGLDVDGLSPYGRSPLMALPLVVKLQQQMIHDMAQAQHNAGYPTIHFRLKTPERDHRESSSQYHERLNREIQQIREEIGNKRADSNLVTYESIEVHYIGPSGQTRTWSESMQAIGEQVVSALHLAPFMIGRNWGTTESWGSAQYQLMTNNARTVQEGAKRLAEWLRNLELILQGCPLQVTQHFAPHHSMDMNHRAQSLQTMAQAMTNLVENRLVDLDEAKQKIMKMIQMI